MAGPCLVDTPTIHHEQTAAGELQSDVRVSAQLGNGIEAVDDGLFVRGAQAMAQLPTDAAWLRDGNKVTLQPEAGLRWEVVYTADSVQTYKWEFAGGSDMFKNQEGAVSLTTDASPAGAWGNGGGGSAGPDLAVPYTGVYDVFFEATVDNSAASTGGTSIGVAQGTAADPIQNMQALQSNIRSAHIMASYRVTLTQGVTLRLRYRCTIPSNVATFTDRRLRIKPVRL